MTLPDQKKRWTVNFLIFVEKRRGKTATSVASHNESDDSKEDETHKSQKKKKEGSPARREKTQESLVKKPVCRPSSNAATGFRRSLLSTDL